MAPPSGLSEFRADFDVRLRDYFQTQHAAAAARPVQAAMLADLRDFTLNGGKRIRPALLAYTYRCFDAAHTDDIMTIGIACELMQSALLIHDDVMDHADTRRGKPTIHALETGRTGSAAFGVASAILLGDLVGYLGQEVIADSPFPAAVKAEAMRLYARVMADECYGQYLDMRTTLREPLTEADALDVIYYKTTRYTFEFPMQLAGLLAGVDASGQAQLSGLARDLGLAFQLVDDRIGLFGEAAVTGKSPLSDLAEGKQTLLMIHTRERIGPADRSYLDTVLGNSAATPDDLQRVRRLVRDCGAYDAVETVIDAARRRAEATLAQADYRPDGKRFLRELTAYLTERDH